MSKTIELARRIRIHSLQMANQAGTSHIGSCLSCADILAVLYGEVMHYRPQEPDWEGREMWTGLLRRYWMPLNNNTEVDEVAVADLYPNRDGLIPRCCPIDGSPFVLIEGTFVCESESHNWELSLGSEGLAEFYKLELTGY